MKISIVGTGFVGLVTEICFADGHTDGTSVGVDKTNFENFYRGVIPVNEPGTWEKFYFPTDLKDIRLDERGIAKVFPDSRQ